MSLAWLNRGKQKQTKKRADLYFSTFILVVITSSTISLIQYSIIYISIIIIVDHPLCCLWCCLFYPVYYTVSLSFIQVVVDVIRPCISSNYWLLITGCQLHELLCCRSIEIRFLAQESKSVNEQRFVLLIRESLGSCSTKKGRKRNTTNSNSNTERR